MAQWRDDQFLLTTLLMVWLNREHCCGYSSFFPIISFWWLLCCHSGGEAQTDRAHTKWEKDSPGCQFSFFGAARVLIQGKEMKNDPSFKYFLLLLYSLYIYIFFFYIFLHLHTSYIIKQCHISCYVQWNTTCFQHQPGKIIFYYTSINISNSLML